MAEREIARRRHKHKRKSYVEIFDTHFIFLQPMVEATEPHYNRVVTRIYCLLLFWTLLAASFCELAQASVLSSICDQILRPNQHLVTSKTLRHVGEKFKTYELVGVKNLGQKLATFATQNPTYLVDSNQVPRYRQYVAEEFEISFKSKDSRRRHRIHVVISDISEIDLDEILAVLKDMPAVLLLTISKISSPPINTARFGVAANASHDGKINLMPWILGGLAGDYPENLKGFLYHEAGHTLASHIWGRSQPPKLWEAAQAADGTSISNYGDTSSTEDFAEAVQQFFLEALLKPLRISIGGEFWKRLRFASSF